MMVKAIVIKPGGKPTLKDLDGFTGLKAELDGGFVEGIRFTTNSFAYLDEDGKRKGLTLNYLATFLCEFYDVGLGPNDSIVGTFIIVGNPRDGEFMDVPETLIAEIIKEEP